MVILLFGDLSPTDCPFLLNHIYVCIYNSLNSFYISNSAVCVCSFSKVSSNTGMLHCVAFALMYLPTLQCLRIEGLWLPVLSADGEHFLAVEHS